MSQTLPAPVAMPPSESPIVMGIVAVIAPLLTSTRMSVLSPQLGTQRLPKPAARPEQGRLPLPSATVAATLLDAASKRETLSLGSFETQTDC
jgi:hypothetical protein